MVSLLLKSLKIHFFDLLNGILVEYRIFGPESFSFESVAVT